MRIWINGREQRFENIYTLKDVLEVLNYERKFIAVALNMECVPRHEYEHKIIQEGDSIEILSPMQGG